MNPTQADEVTRAAEELARAVAEQVSFTLEPHRHLCGAAHMYAARVEQCKRNLTAALRGKSTP